MLAKATGAATESVRYDAHARVAHGGAFWDTVSKHAAAAIESSFSRSPVFKSHERDACAARLDST